MRMGDSMTRTGWSNFSAINNGITMTTARAEILTRIRTILSRPDLPFPPVEAPPLTAAERTTVTHADGTPAPACARFARS